MAEFQKLTTERRREEFEQLFKSLKDEKAAQAALVNYIRDIDNIGQVAPFIDPNGMRIRANKDKYGAYFVESGDRYQLEKETVLRAAFNGESRPKLPEHKQPIPTLPLPIFRHHIQSLLPLIRGEHPKPLLRDVTNNGQSEMDFWQDYNLRTISNLIYKATYDKLKRGIDPNAKGIVRQVQTEAIMCGTSGMCFGTDGEDFWFEFLPFDSIYLSKSRRWVAIERELYKSDDHTGFKFLDDKFKTFEDQESMETCRTYFELYDLTDEVVYYLVDDGREVKKSKPFGDSSEFSVIIFSLGQYRNNDVYASGLLDITAVVAEELIVAASVINYEARQAGIDKPIISGDLAKDEEFIEQLNDPTKLYALASGSGMTPDKFSVAMWRRVNNLQDWISYWGFMHNLLVQYQFLPDISRGLASPNTAYMKAGTAQELSRPRSIFAEMLIGETRDLYEQIYRKTLTFFKANPEVQVVSDMLNDQQRVMLKKDYLISVRVNDIKAVPEQEQQQRMTALMQVAPNMPQALQSVMAMIEMSGLTVNKAALTGKIFEDVFGISVFEFAEAPQEQNMMQGMTQGLQPPMPQGIMGPVMPQSLPPNAPPLPAGGGSLPPPPVPQDESVMVDAVVQFLSTSGREDLINTYLTLSDKNREEYARRLVAAREDGDAEMLDILLDALDSAQGAADPDRVIVGYFN